ncbi:MAG: hypothetical protein P3X22_007540 [Thermoprotei archaeon]|nr:hypothetical protein [Thermoprotei archaeon]
MRRTVSTLTLSAAAFIDNYASTLWDPEVYGPGVSRVLRLSFSAVALSSPLLFVIGAVLVIVYNTPLLIFSTPLVLLLVLFAASRVWRLALGSGVDKELPAVLAYLLPYTRSPVQIADLIARLRDEEGYFWFKFEASRLKLLLDLGYDPISALKKLSETTPSRRLAEVIDDYIHVQTLGASRGQVTILLFRHAMDSVRDQWRGHIEFGKLVAEGIVAAVVSMVALAPVALLGGGYPVILALIPLIVAPAGALAMLATRPALGEYRVGYPEAIITLTVPVVAVALNFKLSLEAGLAYLVGMTIVVEAMALGFRRLSSNAFRELRAAVDEARLGTIPEDRLARAEKAAKGVIKAIISASRVAGTMGVSDALSQLYSLIEEAQRQVRSASTQAVILALISVASLPLAMYSLKILSASAAPLGMVNTASIEEVLRIMAATSPLIALSASVLQRGWLISPLYPLIAQALTMMVLAA